MEGIKGKVVAITGASSGIGRAIAEVLAHAGAKVVLGARNEAALQELAADLQGAGAHARYLRTDVAKMEDVEALVGLARQEFGRLDVLVSSAGVAPISPFAKLQLADWIAMLDVNVKGLLHGIAAALPVFGRQGSGHFVNIVSTAALQVSPTMGVYAASKNAVRTISEGLRVESDGRYRVTGVSPGFVATNLAQSMTDADMQTAVQARMDEIALAPKDVARAVAFAISQPDHVDIGDLVIRPTVQD